MKASANYPAENCAIRTWLKTMGHTPTIMDYSRFNYVAQPEDHVPVADLVPAVGPYDRWAVHWGYADIHDATTPREELKAGCVVARTGSNAVVSLLDGECEWNGPGENVEAVGDQDAIRSTAAGLRNLNRVMDYLPDVTKREGDGYADLSSIYERVLGQWVLEMRHVAAIVGGMESQQKHYGQDGVRFTAVPRDRQRAAVQFLADNAFATPRMLIRPDVLRRMEPAGELSRIRNAQMGILSTLLSPQRLGRMVEQESIDPLAAYRPGKFLDDVRAAIFQELRTGVSECGCVPAESAAGVRRVAGRARESARGVGRYAAFFPGRAEGCGRRDFARASEGDAEGDAAASGRPAGPDRDGAGIHDFRRRLA